MTATRDTARLTLNVIEGGYCVGCGACGAAEDGPSIALDRYGVYRPDISGSDEAQLAAIGRVCPFADPPDETELADEYVAGSRGPYAGELGPCLSTWAGHVADPDERGRATSGGLMTWLLVELLRAGDVNGVVHLKPVADPPTGGPYFEYAVSHDEAGVRAGVKSRYHPGQIGSVVRHMLDHDGRYAVTALPCVAKALRLLMREHPVLRERVAFVLGPFCGHLKSSRYAQLFAWQLGVEPDRLTAIDYRHKTGLPPANRYGVLVRGRGPGDEPVERTAVSADLFGTDWGKGYFKPQACDYCDDVVGETADVSCGDAWLPRFKQDPDGTSLLIVRNARIEALLRAGAASGRLALKPIDPGEVVASQAGSYWHRRVALAYRLLLRRRAGQWAPRKRVIPSAAGIGRFRRRIVRLRAAISARSHTAWDQAVRAGSFEEFRRLMRPIENRYARYYAMERGVNQARRLLGRVKRLVVGQ